jgi:hypothetical protein
VVVTTTTIQDPKAIPASSTPPRRHGLTMASVGRSQVELARRLCAAYASFRMRTRSIDSVLRHMPKKIGNFWIELARLVSLQKRRSGPDQNNEMLTDGSKTQATYELPDEAGHISAKTRAKRRASKRWPPDSKEKRPT